MTLRAVESPHSCVGFFQLYSCAWGARLGDRPVSKLSIGGGPAERWLALSARRQSRMGEPATGRQRLAAAESATAERHVPNFVLVRLHVQLPAHPGALTILLIAQGGVTEAYIDGARAGTEHFEPTWTVREQVEDLLEVPAEKNRWSWPCAFIRRGLRLTRMRR